MRISHSACRIFLSWTATLRSVAEEIILEREEDESFEDRHESKFLRLQHFLVGSAVEFFFFLEVHQLKAGELFLRKGSLVIGFRDLMYWRTGRDIPMDTFLVICEGRCPLQT